MSHIVTIRTKVRDPAAVAAACARLGLAAPERGTAELYAGPATGLLVRLSGWEYPVVADTASGELRYDNFEGAWGDPAKLDAFLQAYAVEKAKIEARQKGFQVSEQPLADGSIRVLIIEAAG